MTFPLNQYQCESESSVRLRDTEEDSEWHASGTWRSNSPECSCGIRREGQPRLIRRADYIEVPFNCH